jgi:hypothetical protein
VCGPEALNLYGSTTDTEEFWYATQMHRDAAGNERVLVLQRRTTAFTADEVTLATALGAPVTLAIERRLASAVRSARLGGRAHVPGAVLGRAGLVPTTTALGAVPVEIERAFGRLRDDLGRAMKTLAESTVPAVGTRSPESILSVVVLPAPVGPMTPTRSPGAIATDTPSTALTVSYSRRTSERSEPRRPSPFLGTW